MSLFLSPFALSDAWGQQRVAGPPASIRHFERVEDLVSHRYKRRAAKGKQVISFRSLGRRFDVEMEPNEIFATNAREVWVADNHRTEREPRIALYKGKLTDDPNSWVRLSIRDGALDGMIWTPEEIYFLEPGSRFFGEAGKSETVAYRISDTESDWPVATCALEDPDIAEAMGLRRHAAPRALSFDSAPALLGGGASTLQEAEIAIVADYEYYQEHLGSSAADMQSIMNQVDGIFKADTGLTLKVVETVVHTTSADPFSNTNSATLLLNEFTAYKGSPSSPIYDTDLAHLFTDRDLLGSTAGIAWVGTVCWGEAACALSQDWTTHNKSMLLLVAHEIGHNLDAPHDNETGSACSYEPFGHIMNPWLDTNLALAFSDCSKSIIGNRLASAWCLDTVQDETATPSPTPTPTHTPESTPTGPTSTPTDSPVPTATGVPTDTPVPPATETPTEIPTATETTVPTATRTHTAVPSPSPTPGIYSIEGGILYYRDDRPVAGVTVRDLGPPVQEVTTNSVATYGFGNLPKGQHVAQPMQIGNIGNAVSSLDAARVLQAIVEKVEFDDFQKLACDVTGNGLLSSLDAARILQFIVGKLDQFPVAEACESDWAFVPQPAPVLNQRLIQPEMFLGSCRRGAIAFEPLAEHSADQNFVAVVFGDCTGNWTPPAGAGAESVQNEPRAAVRVGRLRRVSATRFRLRLSIVAAAPFHSLDLRLQHGAELRASGIHTENLSGDAMARIAPAGDGGTVVALASGTALGSNGREVLELEFTSHRASVRHHPVRAEFASVDEQTANISSFPGRPTHR